MPGMGFTERDELWPGQVQTMREFAAGVGRLSNAAQSLAVQKTKVSMPGPPGPLQAASTYNGAVVDPLPTTRAAEETDIKRRQEKYQKALEEFVRTGDPVTYGAMLQYVSPASELVQYDVNTLLDQGPTHPHGNAGGTEFRYKGEVCEEGCPCYRPPSRRKNYPCGDCGKRHPASPCPEAWRKGDQWAMSEAPSWPPAKRWLLTHELKIYWLMILAMAVMAAANFVFPGMIG